MKVVSSNRRAKFDLTILQTVEAGVVLTGQEVKSCRAGHAHLAGSYVSFLHGTAWLKNSKIPPYSFATVPDGYDPLRDRLLLLSRMQMDELRTVSQEKGMTVVPLEMRAGKYIKILLGIGRGQRTRDKREKIKERDMSRRMRAGEEL